MSFTDSSIIDAILRGLVLGSAALLWVVMLVRVNGLRSLSKMTNFDFVMTVAMGSLVAGASQATEWDDVAQVGAAMAALFIFQNLTARIRKSSDVAEEIMQNNPILLMKDGEICHAALKDTRVAESDLIAKLREANALDMSKVRAVVLETTGDVSVLHGDDKVDERLLKNMRDMTDKS
ncbi:MAG: YetF domain-containing protein [Pontixanthobacter sp.]